MKSVNDLTLIGHVGNPPEMRTTTAGTRVAKFSLATNFKIRDDERTDWHRCVAFGKLADIVEQYVGKGDRLYLEGRLHYSQTEGEGGTRYWTEIIVEELVMLGSDGEKRSPQTAARASSGSEDGSGLPF
jgi:single-strand DNA-binding protein